LGRINVEVGPIKIFSMDPAKTFRDLIVWQKSHQYVLGVYEYTKNLPSEEKFALTNQFRRAAVSIAANIAEGFKKRTNREKIRLMNIGQGSLEECRYYEILSKDLEYGDTSHLTIMLEEVSRLLTAYMKKLR